MIRIFIYNTLLFLVIMMLYTITVFLLGYGSNDSYQIHAWIVFFIYAFAHLILNYWIVKKYKGESLRVWLKSYLYIITLYMIVVLIYQT